MNTRLMGVLGASAKWRGVATVFLVVAGLVNLARDAGAQSRLPLCPDTGYRANCVGSHTYANGDKYVGEFRDDKRYGQGAYTLDLLRKSGHFVAETA